MEGKNNDDNNLGDRSGPKHTRFSFRPKIEIRSADNSVHKQKLKTMSLDGDTKQIKKRRNRPTIPFEENRNSGEWEKLLKENNEKVAYSRRKAPSIDSYNVKRNVEKVSHDRVFSASESSSSRLEMIPNDPLIYLSDIIETPNKSPNTVRSSFKSIRTSFRLSHFNQQTFSPIRLFWSSVLFTVRILVSLTINRLFDS